MVGKRLSLVSKKYKHYVQGTYPSLVKYTMGHPLTFMRGCPSYKRQYLLKVRCYETTKGLQEGQQKTLLINP